MHYIKVTIYRSWLNFRRRCKMCCQKEEAAAAVVVAAETSRKQKPVRPPGLRQANKTSWLFWLSLVKIGCRGVPYVKKTCCQKEEEVAAERRRRRRKTSKMQKPATLAGHKHPILAFFKLYSGLCDTLGLRIVLFTIDHI